MINREEYMNFLIKLKDKQIIKVVTGIRRCGKSTLLALYKEYLIANGVDNRQIIDINFEDPKYLKLGDWESLYNYIDKLLVPNTKNYIFLDEIQNIEHFERAVDGLYIKDNVDLYITGSNSFLLSSELATLLTGRYMPLHMLPLSFKEFCLIRGLDGNILDYNLFIKDGGFPYVSNLDNDYTLIRSYIDSLYSTVVLKDIINQYKIKEPLIFESLTRFLFDNISSLISTKKISDTLKSSGRSNSVNTIESYVDNLTSAYMFYKITRFDIKGKEHLKTGYKYYLSDLAFRYYSLGEISDRGRILENVVFLEFKRRGYEIFIGKINEYEIDFVIKNEDGIKYVQVSESVRSEDTLDRELRGLLTINDNYPKYLITLDQDYATHNGVKQIYLLDYLLGSVDL